MDPRAVEDVVLHQKIKNMNGSNIQEISK